jgi:hypothetical protein
MNALHIASTLPIDGGWILGIITILGSTVGTMGGAMWIFMVNRLKKQDEIIKGLQEDVARMSKGCGIPECLWKGR